MKRVVTALAILATMATAASAQIVTSRNAVGFIETSAPGPSKLSLLTMPFFKVAASGSANTLDEIFGDQLTGNDVSFLADQIWKWDVGFQQYVVFYKRTAGEWHEDGVGATTETLAPGESFWIVSGPLSVDQDVVLKGEVPDRFTQDGKTIQVKHSGAPTLNFVSYSYPVEKSFSSMNTAEAVGSTVSFLADQIWTWDIVTQSYEVFYYYDNGVDPAYWAEDGTTTASTKSLQPGEGSWYVTSPISAGDSDWTESKPYAWP